MNTSWEMGISQTYIYVRSCQGHKNKGRVVANKVGFSWYLTSNARGVARLEMKCTHKPEGVWGPRAVIPSLGPGQIPVGGPGGFAPGSCRILANLSFIYFFLQINARQYTPFLYELQNTVSASLRMQCNCMLYNKYFLFFSFHLFLIFKK